VNTKLNINQWAEEDRPREKMERLGAQALSDAELLAILVGSGSTKEDAVAQIFHINASSRIQAATLFCLRCLKAVLKVL
jgi:DNA repair protein RadC